MADGTGDGRNGHLSSRNPCKQQASNHSISEQAYSAPEQQTSQHSDKQVVSSEAQSGPSNAPMIVAQEPHVNVEEQQPPLDSEKQVVNPEARSMAIAAPPVLEKEALVQPKADPLRDADKEVLSSWQSESQGDSTPISMDYHESQGDSTPIAMAHHESQLHQPDLLHYVQGPPPSYESLNGGGRSANDGLIPTSSPIEPDGSASILPPRAEDRTAVGQLLSWIPGAPRISVKQMPPLVQPVIIPQLDVPPQGESVPFARCYSDALASHDVPMRDFVSFLDGLALAQAPNSALQGLKMFGAGVTALPLPIIGLAGKGISALATSGSGHSGSRARLYLERAKKEYFAPRGLKLLVVKDNDLSPRLQIPTHASRLAPLTQNTLTNSSCQRRLNGLAPYISPLRFDVPEQGKQIQGVHKLARKHLEGQFREQNRRLTRLREEQWENISHASAETRGWDEQYAAKTTQLQRVQQDLINEQNANGFQPASKGRKTEVLEVLQRLQRELQIMESERHMAMQRTFNKSQGVEAEMEEVNQCRRLKWIVSPLRLGSVPSVMAAHPEALLPVMLLQGNIAIAKITSFWTLWFFGDEAASRKSVTAYSTREYR
ncbi:hypothetical protein LTR37_007898 [Vermiconidia calcicola]|uniref:Uncharacterized protein n=1 Tax=Vermiconidia calcicola TaxID=1690605 RepID=A0ACC3NCD7_9PEZI|nr:hypothetical protein LTR37_007898 [Vermiconidia calcicola]